MLTWTEDDDRTFHRYAWSTEAGWVEMTTPCPLDELAPPPPPCRHPHRRWLWVTSCVVVAAIWILSLTSR